MDGFGRIVADFNDFVGFDWISVHSGDLSFYDLGGFGWIWAEFCRFGWICSDSLREDLKLVLIHFDRFELMLA